MSDDIIEIKPGIGPFKLNVVALVRRLSGKGKKDPVAVVAERFLQLFHAHGIAIPQIPRLISQVTLEKLQNTESLLTVLSSDVLEYTTALFGVQRSWLEGVDDRIYETMTCYKQPRLFLETCAALNLPENGFAVRALTSAKTLDGLDDRSQQLAIVLVEKVQNLGNDEIVRYHIYRDAWDWSHTPCRIQLKAMARIMMQHFQRPIPIHKVKSTVLQAIIEGKRIPHAALQGCLLTNPSLEDFALSCDESVQAKETGELSTVLDFIYHHKLEKFAEMGFWEISKV